MAKYIIEVHDGSYSHYITVEDVRLTNQYDPVGSTTYPVLNDTNIEDVADAIADGISVTLNGIWVSPGYSPV